MHNDEWTEYHRIRKEQIFKPAGVIYDAKHFSLKDDNHHHFILYKGFLRCKPSKFLTTPFNLAFYRSFQISFQNPKQSF